MQDHTPLPVARDSQGNKVATQDIEMRDAEIVRCVCGAFKVADRFPCPACQAVVAHYRSETP